MQLVKKYEIQSKDMIKQFLNSQPVGRIASLDRNGFPQIIPMNFVYQNDAIYMHSHPFGEKLENIRRNPDVGFEADQHICFLPSYYFHPTDASQADTLYISVVIKGKAEIVDSMDEKAIALNALMEKYQKEGRYEVLDAYTPSVREVAVIKVIPSDMRGKYKIGQQWSRPYRLRMARNIIKREGLKNAENIVRLMGIDLTNNGLDLVIKEDPIM
ncbi:MAG: pyridoxamine 5'-phosphate oxidase family protein [Thermoproteota archaeon]|nr:pyridoxamine 5'-phosphate oxidase family protein [Thermoproteota archaeon]